MILRTVSRGDRFMLRYPALDDLPAETVYHYVCIPGTDISERLCVVIREGKVVEYAFLDSSSEIIKLE